MNQKRQLLIDTALRLFYEKGINSIGINEVIKVAGVAKRTLYSHFDSKDALVIATLQQRHDDYMRWLGEELSGVESNRDLIQQLFMALDCWFNNASPLGVFRGCFFINTSAEFSRLNSDIFLFCNAHKQQVRQFIDSKIKTKNSSLIDAICIMKEGAIVTAHINGNGQKITSQCIDALERIEAGKV